MTQSFAKGDLEYWVSLFSREGKNTHAMSDRPKAMAYLRHQTIDDINQALEGALKEAFNGTPPYDIYEYKFPRILVEFADDAIKDLGGPYATFINHVLNAFDMLGSLAKNKEVSDLERPITKPQAKAHVVSAPVVKKNAPVAVPQPETESMPDGSIIPELRQKTYTYGERPGSQDADRIRSGELMRLPGVLPPPPLEDLGDLYGKWLEGEIWHPLAFGIHLTLRDTDPDDDLIEMQSEFFAMPASARATYNARQPASPEAENAADHARFLHSAGRDVGFQQWVLDKAGEEFAASVARYLQEFEPVAADFLDRVGYNIKMDEQLVWIVASALDIEKFYMDNGPDDAGEGGLQDLRGTISHRKRLDTPVILDRAVMLHFFTGKPLSTGLVETLRELRHAQLCRHLDREIPASEFDPKFVFDMFFELDEYFSEYKDEPEISMM
jgi:hypothetical protein